MMSEEDVQVGMPAPDFRLPDASDKDFHLSAELAAGAVMLLFYPSDFGIVCSLEMRTFQGMRDEFEAKGVQVVGISRNSIMTHKQWKESMDLQMRLLSDEDGEVCTMYAGLQNFGLLKGFPRRAVLIVDRKGIIRYVWIATAEGLAPPFEEVRERIRTEDI
jgi:peroxiredoxin Q/BCP